MADQSERAATVSKVISAQPKCLQCDDTGKVEAQVVDAKWRRHVLTLRCPAKGCEARAALAKADGRDTGGEHE